jgi:four helix bundle protein
MAQRLRLYAPEVHMARDHRKLRVFHDAHALTLAIYKSTRNFPREEWYALRQQMRRAAVSIPSNIVEGNARRTTREYVHFLNVSRGSAAELNYLIDLASELSFLAGAVFKALNDHCARVCRQLESLLQTMEIKLLEEQAENQRSGSSGFRTRKLPRQVDSEKRD